MPARECSRTACVQPAVSTLTFVYEDATAVLGPLSRSSEPHTYDLCRDHASRLTTPRGWELLRVPGGPEASDELVALADAVRTRPAQAPSDPLPSPGGTGPAERPDPTRGTGAAGRGSGGRGRDGGRHLHVIRSPHE